MPDGYRPKFLSGWWLWRTWLLDGLECDPADLPTALFKNLDNYESCGMTVHPGGAVSRWVRYGAEAEAVAALRAAGLVFETPKGVEESN